MFDYQLKIASRSRRLQLKITPQGKLLVTVPPLTPRFIIHQFINKNETWITHQLSKISQQTLIPPDQFYLFGQKYQLKFGYLPQKKTGFHLCDQQLFYNSSKYLLHPKASSQLVNTEKKLLFDFAKQTLNTYLNQRVATLAQKMQVLSQLGRICIKNQASRWGSCSSLGNLNFNLKLVHQPPVIIDYVIIHELAHLVHLNHSRQFWALVAKFDGNYHLHRRQLSQNKNLLFEF